MGNVGNAVNNRVTHNNIRRCHINLGTKHLLTIAELTGLHFLEKLQIFLNTAVTIRTFLAWLSEGSTIGTDFLSGKVINVSQALLNQLHSIIVKLAEIIRSKKHSVIPAEAQPFNILLNGIYIFHILFYRIGVIKTQITNTAVIFGKAKVQANRLGMANVQITIWLRWETGMNPFRIISVL